MGAWYHDPGTLSSGSDGPFTEKSGASNLLQRVGGRAGTAAPQGAVCELPNPVCFVDFLGSNQLLRSFPAIQFKAIQFKANTVRRLHSNCIQYDASCRRMRGISKLAERSAGSEQQVVC